MEDAWASKDGTTTEWSEADKDAYQKKWGEKDKDGKSKKDFSAADAYAKEKEEWSSKGKPAR